MANERVCKENFLWPAADVQTAGGWCAGCLNNLRFAVLLPLLLRLGGLKRLHNMAYGWESCLVFANNSYLCLLKLQ